MQELKPWFWPKKYFDTYLGPTTPIFILIITLSFFFFFFVYGEIKIYKDKYILKYICKYNSRW